MKTVKQLLRQPLKTVIGIVFMTLAAAVVCLCVGQAVAAHVTKETLDQRFSTVAIPLVQKSLEGDVDTDSFLMDEELVAWLDRMAEAYPQIVRGVAKHGILSAYIPELNPYIPDAKEYGVQKTLNPAYTEFQASPYAMPNSCAMLVITLEEIEEPYALWDTVEYEPFRLTEKDFINRSDYLEYLNTLKYATVQTGYQAKLVGTVTGVVALADGHRDPVGMRAQLTLQLPTLEAFEELDLEPGGQYIVYGMDYVDTHRQLIGTMESVGAYDYYDFTRMENFDPELLYILTPEQVEETQGVIVAKYDYISLTQYYYEKLNAISMTLDGVASLVRFEEIRDEDGYLVDVVDKTEFTVTDGNGKTVTLSEEEYDQRYETPKIAPLEGSVEDFLTSEEGALWKSALECTEINNHAFTVIGVDRLNYLAEFSLQYAKIVQGRDFTADELESGARVCLVQEALATAQGMEVGDTVTLSFYSTDRSLPYQSFREDGKGILNPTASFYFATTPFTETAEYTIVGFYQDESWPDVEENPYGFSANTVFVPKSSVQTPMEESESIVLNTVVLENGMLEEFHELVLASGFGGRLRYNDQNYGTIAANFHNYETLGRQVLVIGAVIYTVLLALFLLLYPGSVRKNIRTMQSFGAGFFRRFGYVLTSSLAIVIPASLLGGWVGSLLWDEMVAALQTTAESAVALQIEPGMLAGVAGAQLLAALVLSIFVALFVAAPTGISRRK